MARRISNIQPKKPQKSHRGELAAYILLALVLFIGYQHTRKTSPTSTTTSVKTITTPSSVLLNTTLTNNTQLDSLLATWAAKQSFASSVVVEQLTGSKPIAAHYSPSSSIVTASTFKLYIAYAILHGVEQGQYTMGMKLSDGYTLQTDLTNMIINSDNAASRTLGFLYGWKNANALLAAQGITHTNLYNYVPPSTAPVGDKYTTSADLSLFLDKLYHGSLLSTANTKLLLGLMEQQNYRERIPAGVPSGVVVADKPGWLTGEDDDGTTEVENDAAIVYGPKSTYILVIMSKGSTTQPLANLSSQVYNYLEG